MDYGVRAVAIG